MDEKKKSISLKVKPDIYGGLSAINFVQKTRIVTAHRYLPDGIGVR
jgi:hypothetical protein